MDSTGLLHRSIYFWQLAQASWLTSACSVQKGYCDWLCLITELDDNLETVNKSADIYFHNINKKRWSWVYCGLCGLTANLPNGITTSFLGFIASTGFYFDGLNHWQIYGIYNKQILTPNIWYMQQTNFEAKYIVYIQQTNLEFLYEFYHKVWHILTDLFIIS